MATMWESVSDVSAACKREGKKLVIINDMVVDVAGFKHPGPQNLITDNVGNDISSLFIDQGHSKYAWDLCRKRQIGKIRTNPGSLLNNSYTALSREEAVLHARVDQKIDCSKPLLPQVEALTVPEFRAFVSRPRYADGEDSIRLHADISIDSARKVRYEDNVKVISPAVLVFLILGFSASTSAAEFAVKASMCGLIGVCLVWTLVEYYFHRFVLHKELTLSDRNDVDGAYLARIFSSHLHHHVFMNQRLRIAIPVRVFVYVGGPLAGAIRLMLPAVMAWPMVAGVLAGGLLYDALHLAFHFDDVLPSWVYSTQYFIMMKSAHMRHHFRDNQREFGVSTSLWDTVCGTPRRQ